MAKNKLPPLSLAQVAEKENKTLRWINHLVNNGRIKGAEQPIPGGQWIVSPDYKILPPAAAEDSKTAKAVDWLEKNPNAKASEAAKLFDVHPGSISWLRKKRREEK